MNKQLFLILATLALLSFAQDEPEVSVEALDDTEVDANGGEVVTENIEVEVTTVVPDEPEDTVINVEEVTIVEETQAPVEDVTIVEENTVVNQEVIVQETEAPVEEVTVVEETVIVQEGDQPDTVVDVDEVVIVEESAPVVEEVNIVNEDIIVEETIIIVEESAPAVTEVTVVEENIVVEEGDAADTIVNVDEVVIVEENIIEGVDLEDGEPLDLGGTVTGSVTGNVSVSDWLAKDGKMASASVAMLVVGAVFMA